MSTFNVFHPLGRSPILIEFEQFAYVMLVTEASNTRENKIYCFFPSDQCIIKTAFLM